MKKRLFSLLLILVLILTLSHNVEAVKRVWGFYGIIGGAGTEALDGIPSTGSGTYVVTGDYAIGRDATGYFYIYYYDGTSLTASSSPRVVRPADIASDATAGRWIIAPRLYSDSYYSTAIDLNHYLNVSNTANPSFARSDGDFYTRSDTGTPFIYTTTDSGEDIPILNAKRRYIPTAAGSGGQTLLARHLYGCTISNVYANGLVYYNLPAAAYGMEVTIYCAVAQQTQIKPIGTNDTIRGGGGCTTVGWRVGSAVTPVVGDFITLKTMYNPSKTGGAGYDWYIFQKQGTWACTGAV